MSVVEGAQTLERGIRLLSLLAQTPAGLTVSELSRELAVGRTVIYRLVVSLDRNSLVRRDESGRYHIGLGILALAGSWANQLQVLVQPTLERLCAETGATVVAATADAEETIVLAVAEPENTDIYLAARVGARAPITRSAAGQLILGHRDGRVPREQVVSHNPPGVGSAHSVAVLASAGGGLELAIEVLILGSPAEEVPPMLLRASREIGRALAC